MNKKTEAGETEIPFDALTYALIVRSEDKGRNILETVVYLLLMLSALTTFLPLG